MLRPNEQTQPFGCYSFSLLSVLFFQFSVYCLFSFSLFIYCFNESICQMKDLGKICSCIAIKTDSDLK